MKKDEIIVYSCFVLLCLLIVGVATYGIIRGDGCDDPGSLGYYSTRCIKKETAEIKSTLDELWLNVEAIRENRCRGEVKFP